MGDTELLNTSALLRSSQRLAVQESLRCYYPVLLSRTFFMLHAQFALLHFTVLFLNASDACIHPNETEVQKYEE